MAKCTSTTTRLKNMTAAQRRPTHI
jgi:hypothetical protein